ncbi:hypothetical protein CONPUDRAFT_77198 [Coniophora puteana RWD-64-598 SS2]|uniref:Uncharacterized protein n=1 Tax=Coniophora puteana (strain RWD-64-598) TaxID=741705 RepID=A0A5M3M8L1_CONPW|nr:uncharacterized protein CONPUDRAFT_77198 [Coniophora puteana RWD-64-598 SS2]EIW75519.1 hypothetical protein CONPUDRAFT_77198 [Coniophora puteana RWD-64-598 SS2]
MAAPIPLVPITTLPFWAVDLDMAWPSSFNVAFATRFLGVSESRFQAALRHRDKLPEKYFGDGMRAEFDDIKGVLIPLWAALRHTVTLPPFIALVNESHGVGAALDRLRHDPARQATCLQWQPETSVSDLGGDEWWHDFFIPTPPPPTAPLLTVSASTPPRFRRSARVVEAIIRKDAPPSPPDEPTPPPTTIYSAVRAFAPNAAGFHGHTVPKAKKLQKFDAVVITMPKKKASASTSAGKKRAASTPPATEPPAKKPRGGGAKAKKGKGKQSNSPKARGPRRPTLTETIPDHLAIVMEKGCTRCREAGVVCLRAEKRVCKRCGTRKQGCDLEHEKAASRVPKRRQNTYKPVKKSAKKSAKDAPKPPTPTRSITVKRTGDFPNPKSAEPYMEVDDEASSDEWEDTESDDEDGQEGKQPHDAKPVQRTRYVDVSEDMTRLIFEADAHLRIANLYMSSLVFSP